MIPSRTAMETASSFEWAPSLASTDCTWLRIVLTLRKSSAAMSLLVHPRARNPRISRSRSLRSSPIERWMRFSFGSRRASRAGEMRASPMAAAADRVHDLAGGPVLGQEP